MLGLDTSSPEAGSPHRHIVTVLQGYRDVGRAYELYGAPRPEIQIHLEATLGSATRVTLEQIRAGALAHEGRERALLEDLHRQMKKFGVATGPLSSSLDRQNRQRATARQTCNAQQRAALATWQHTFNAQQRAEARLPISNRARMARRDPGYRARDDHGRHPGETEPPVAG